MATSEAPSALLTPGRNKPLTPPLPPPKAAVYGLPQPHDRRRFFTKRIPT